MTVTWSPPPNGSYYGNLTGYRVRYTIKSKADGDVTEEVQYEHVGPQEGGVSGNFSLLLRDLAAFSSYSVRVQAGNEEGYGPLSEPVLGGKMRTSTETRNGPY